MQQSKKKNIHFQTQVLEGNQSYPSNFTKLSFVPLSFESMLINQRFVGKLQCSQINYLNQQFRIKVKTISILSKHVIIIQTIIQNIQLPIVYLQMSSTLVSIQNNILNYANMYHKHVIQERKSDQNTAIKNVLQIIRNQDKEALSENNSIKEDKDIEAIAQQIVDKLKKINIESSNIIEPNKIEKSVQNSTEKKINQSQIKQSNKSSVSSWKSLIFDKFVKKQPEGVKMILPEKQQKTTWDPVRRIFIFQGQEPEQPKQIPKPPPIKTTIPSKNQPKPKQKSQIDEMLAPATFKRKGNKSKAQPVIAEPLTLTYEELITKIQEQFALLKNMNFNKHESQSTSNGVSNVEMQTLGHYEELFKKVNEFESQIHLQIIQQFRSHEIESNLKLNRLTQNVINSFNSNIDSEILAKISNISLNHKNEQTQNSHKNYLQNAQSLKAEQQKAKQYEQLCGKFEKDLKKEKNKLQQLSNANKKLKQELLNQTKCLNDFKMNSNKEINQSKKNFQEQLQIKQKYASKLNQEIEEISKILGCQKAGIRQKIIKIKIEEQKGKNTLQQKNNQSTLYKEEYNKLLKLIKIQQQFIQKMKSHQDLTEQLNSAIQAEYQISTKVQQRRLALHMNVPIPLQLLEVSSVNDSERLLQLSQVTSLMAKGHMEKIKTLQTECLAWQQKYTTAKSALHKKKSQINTQQSSLNRAMSKLKNLNEAYRVQQEKAEERANIAQMESQKLKKQLAHVKQQDIFNKQLLQQSITNFQNLKSQVQNLETTNKELTQQRNKSEQQLKQNQILIEDLQKDLDNQVSKNALLQKRINEIERKHQQEEESNSLQIQQLKVMIQNLQNQKIKKIEEETLILNRHKTQIKKLIDELEDIKIKNNKDINEIQTEKDKLKASFDSQVRVIRNESSENIRKAEEAIKQMKQNEASIKTQNQKLKAEHATIIQDFEREALGYKETINEFSSSMENLRKQQLQLMSEWNEQKSQTEKKMNFLVEQLQQGRKKSENLSKSLSQYRYQVDQITKNYKSTQIIQKQKEIEILIALVEQMENAKKQTDEKLQQKEQLIEAIKRQNEGLLSQEKRLKDSIVQCSDRIRHLEESLGQKENQINELQNSYNLAKEKWQQGNQEYQTLQGQQAQLIMSLQKKEMSLNSFMKNNSEIVKRHQQANQQIKSLKDQIATLKLLQNQQNKDQNAQLQGQIQVLMSSVQALQAQNKSLEQKLTFAENEKQKILNKNQEEMQIRIKRIEESKLKEVNELRSMISQLNIKLEENQRKMSNENMTNKTNQISQNKIKQLQSQILQRTNKYEEVRKKLQQMEEREKMYDLKLKEFEKESINILNVKKQNKKLHDNLKELQIQNNDLLKQKTQILALNQKLMEERSKKPVQKSLINTAPPAQNNKKPVPPPEIKSTGIIGSLSSLFLTPTEVQKMSNFKPK